MRASSLDGDQKLRKRSFACPAPYSRQPDKGYAMAAEYTCDREAKSVSNPYIGWAKKIR